MRIRTISYCFIASGCLLAADYRPGSPTPNAEIRALIRRWDGTSRRRLREYSRPVVCGQLHLALESNDRELRYAAIWLLLNEYGTPEAVEPVIECLDRILSDPKRETLFDRMVCCEILGKFPHEKSIPVLIRALDDPGTLHRLVGGGPDGHVEHIYRAVWAEALLALKAIGGKEVTSFEGIPPSGDKKKKWISEAKAWWKRRQQQGSDSGASEKKGGP